MSTINGKCYICDNDSYFERNALESNTYYDCNICGRYIIDDLSYCEIDRNVFAPFLYYNYILYPPNDDKNYICYLCFPENYDRVQKNPNAHLINIDAVKAWYPDNFSEKIDKILLALAKLSDYYGATISRSLNEFASMFFVKRITAGENAPQEKLKTQLNLLIDYMSKQNLIEQCGDTDIIILPDGWKRVDELQKNISDTKQVFIAMSFADSQKTIQEKIEEGIRNAGYFPLAMNKKEHNNQIVPEILYQIRKSKFVVADFSEKNNGAYYEAGYATGLGKEVVHICNRKKFHKRGHFDIKQKSTVLWETEDEIPELLHKRIEATIGKRIQQEINNE